MKNKFIVSVAFMCATLIVQAQELFVYNEPASNMAAKSIGFRAANYFGKDIETQKIIYHFMPEFMIGINNKFMVHVQAISSNNNNSFEVEGTSVYAKYRFYTVDEVHKHFRMATYIRGSYNSALLHQDELNIMGHNSGIELGFIATQLLHKVAISSTLSYVQAHFNNIPIVPITQENKAIYYSLSIGKLMLPKDYTNYQQTNVNLMCEFLGQKILGNDKYYLDIAPSIQFIVNSQARIDFAYRKELNSNMYRSLPNEFLLKLEYTIFKKG